MILSKLLSVAEYMWGTDSQIVNTKVEGIYDTTTARHGGYLVDVTIHPKLEKYGAKTNEPHIRAFEEDYEALKILWVYPELVNNPENASKWLTADNVTRFEKDDKFLKDFPKCRLIENNACQIKGLKNFQYNQGEEVISIGCEIIKNSKTEKIIEMCKNLEGEKNYANFAFDILTVRDNYKNSTLRYIPNYKEPVDLDYNFSLNELNEIKEIVEMVKKEQSIEEEETL